MDLYPNYNYIEYRNDKRTLKFLVRKMMSMMYGIEEDLKSMRIMQAKKKFDGNFDLFLIIFVFLLRECKKLRNILKWDSILKLLLSGFKDKEIDLKNYITNFKMKNHAIPGDQKLFANETDCCVCFSSFTNDINPIVYCSG